MIFEQAIKMSRTSFPAKCACSQTGERKPLGKLVLDARASGGAVENGGNKVKALCGAAAGERMP